MAEISREFPNLKEFVTLSPVPGFRAWVEGQLADPASTVLTAEQRTALAGLAAKEAPEVSAREALRPVIEALAAHYFLIARSTKGKPVDPVARFHLGNGARLERLNPFGRPLGARHGPVLWLMVNYRYIAEDIEKNHEAFFDRGTIVASPQVRKLARAEETPKPPALREVAG